MKKILILLSLLIYCNANSFSNNQLERINQAAMIDKDKFAYEIEKERLKLFLFKKKEDILNLMLDIKKIEKCIDSTKNIEELTNCKRGVNK